MAGRKLVAAEMEGRRRVAVETKGGGRRLRWKQREDSGCMHLGDDACSPSTTQAAERLERWAGKIENLAVVVHAIAKSCGAKTVVDVGSGQGYLAQALSFEYQLPVVAIDASSHHASVTVARAERIKKHYAVKWCNLHQDHFQFYYLWSAERWRSLTMDIALQNFDVHAFRAAFQMVLEKYFPEASRLSPSIGRQGKALRCQRLRKVVESQMATEKVDDFSCSTLKEQNTSTDDVGSVIYGLDTEPDDIHHGECRKFALFKDFTLSGLRRLGCGSVEDTSLLEIWKDVHPFSEYIGPFWCLRAALGPLVETYILLDRLLFLQEQSNLVEALLFPLFDPTMSPRNMAIIAWKLSANSSEA